MATATISNLLTVMGRRLAAAPEADAGLLARFLASRDEQAFAAIVQRHGPMVFGVCRRVTGDHHLAEDAFQAVFVVLAAKAGSVRPRAALSAWLYGVAYRTSLRSRTMSHGRAVPEDEPFAGDHETRREPAPGHRSPEAERVRAPRG